MEPDHGSISCLWIVGEIATKFNEQEGRSLVDKTQKQDFCRDTLPLVNMGIQDHPGRFRRHQVTLKLAL
jgi:hypothetical protein